MSKQFSFRRKEQRFEYLKTYHQERKQKKIAQRQKLVALEQEKIDFHEENNFGIIFEFSFPFDSCLSKNIFRGFAGGRVFVKRDSKDVIEGLIVELRNDLRKQNIKFFHNKISFALKIEKPNASSDAINFIDVIADIIKKSIDIDDKWFEIHHVSWIINRDQPRIHLTICQDKQFMFNALVCGNCGRPFPITEDQFVEYKNVQTRQKRKRKQCDDCRKV